MPARRVWLTVGLIAALGGARLITPGQAPVEGLPTARETLRAVGKRLSRTMSVRDLSALAGRGDRVLALLTPAERDALTRGWIRFRVEEPVVVTVGAPEASLPFWLADQGFRALPTRLRTADGPFRLFRRTFAAGWVGLGVPGLDRSAPAPYIVFVRTADGLAPPSLHDLTPDRLRVVAAAEGPGPDRDVHHPFDRLPDDLRGSVLIQTTFDERHATAFLTGRAWKTHVPSGPLPDQLTLAFGPDAARSLTWSWRTDPSVRGSAVRLAPARPDGSGPRDAGAVRILTGDAHLVESPNLLNDPVIARHRVAATDLEPDTLYAFAVGDGSAAGWSPWQTVRTGPGRSRDFSFLYLGDPQTGLEGWGRLLREARRRRPDAAFLLIAGDLVDRGNERTNWDHFFLRAAGVFDTLPVMPCAGNHEYLDRGPLTYRATFALPENGPPGLDPGLVYAFRYGDALVAVLDSTSAAYDPAIARAQADWLDATLGSSRETWKFVMFHHPVYASYTKRDNPTLRDAWVPIFDRHRVDLVFQGHDHAYLRTHPMRGGRPADDGTVYVVAVSGDKYYEQESREYLARGLMRTSTYQTVDVAGRRLLYRAFDADGREVDRLEIDKPDGAPRGPVSLPSS